MALALTLSACGGGSSAGGGTSKAASATSVADLGGMDALVAAAKQEGSLHTITLPPDWANYGEIMKAFEAKYGIKIENENPDGSSQDEINAVKSRKGQSRAPDVLDLGGAFAESGAKEGLFAPYKVASWEQIPADLKDATGLFYADYGGFISIGCDAGKVPVCPKTFADLLKPDYKGKQAGNFIPVESTPATVEKGETPISIDWDYLNAGYAKQFATKGIKWEVSVPSDGVYANYYNQAINKTAPHPAAARLWQEFLYSDEGQNLLLKGFTRPIRLPELVKAGTADKEAVAQLPDVSSEIKRSPLWRLARFIDEVLAPLRQRCPKLRVVFEHVTTRAAVEYVCGSGPGIAATVTPQHLLLNRNALLDRGIRPHLYCLPVLKRETDRQALLAVIARGDPRFFLGTDSAPHSRRAKEAGCGCAGVFSAHAAIELYAGVFEQAGMLARLEDFAAGFGADFYGLPRNQGTLTLQRREWAPPASYPFGAEELVPFRAGEAIAWTLRP